MFSTTMTSAKVRPMLSTWSGVVRITCASSASTARLAMSVAATSASMPSRCRARSALTLRIADVPMPAPQIATIFMSSVPPSPARASRAGLVEAGADAVGELLAVLHGEERGGGGVLLEQLQVAEVVAERVHEQRELLGERRVAHQPVVGVHGDPEAELVEQVERVVDELVAPGGDRPGLQVRGRRELEGDLAVLHPVREPAEADPRVVVVLPLDHDVEGEANAVAEAQRPAVEESARDAVEVGRLARVHGDGEPVLGQQVERVAQAARREARLRAGDVEADDAVAAVPERELRDLEAPVVLPHGGHELADADLPARCAKHVLDPRIDAGLDGLDRLVEGEAPRQVLFGRPADLAVEHSV